MGEAFAARLRAPGVDLALRRCTSAEPSPLAFVTPRHRRDRRALQLLSRRDRLRRTLAPAGGLARPCAATSTSARSRPSTAISASRPRRARRRAGAAPRPASIPISGPSWCRRASETLRAGRGARCGSRPSSRRARRTSTGSIPDTPPRRTRGALGRLGPALVVMTRGGGRRGGLFRRRAADAAGAGHRGRRHGRRRRQLHVGAAGRHGGFAVRSGPARRAHAERSRGRPLADVRHRGLGHHLHPAGRPAADPGRARQGAGRS